MESLQARGRPSFSATIWLRSKGFLRFDFLSFSLMSAAGMCIGFRVRRWRRWPKRSANIWIRFKRVSSIPCVEGGGDPPMLLIERHLRTHRASPERRYRRGKEYSNDVDIVFSRPGIDPKQDRGMCQALVTRLQDEGLVTHVMLLSSFTSHHSPFSSRSSTSSQEIDTLDTALTVFKFHGEGRVHRRLDLIFAPWNVYWTAVVGWTGSTQFERDLRIWAKQERGMKFDSSGITRVHNSEQVFVHSEEEVFQVLGLPWIDPTMRNANA